MTIYKHFEGETVELVSEDDNPKTGQRTVTYRLDGIGTTIPRADWDWPKTWPDGQVRHAYVKVDELPEELR
jgi:hypothetical protein